jgi:hypothetical protein
MLLRFDERNVRVQCVGCNHHKRGNEKVFAERLNEERPGIAEILYEESNTVYKFTREELKSMIADYSNKLKKIQ